MQRQRIFIIAAFLATTSFIGCGDDVSSDDASGSDTATQDAVVDGHEENINEEGCEHAKEGPFVPATGTTAPAAGTDAASAVEIKADHHAYRVSLSAGQQGWIRFSADEAGELIVFVGQDVALEAKDDQNPSQSIPIEDKSAVDECTEVTARHTLDIESVGTVYLLLGGGASDTGEVTLVAEFGHHAGH